MHINEKMITLAQKYCKDNYRYWIIKYQNERTGNNYPYTYTDEYYDLFPRYLALAAILKEVDLLVGQKFKDFDRCMQKLLNAADYPDNEPNEKIRLPKEDEKRKFREFILGLDENTLAKTEVKGTGYRKKLGKYESDKIRKKLREHWSYNGRWYPLAEKPGNDVLYVMEKYIIPFEREIVEIIRTISQKRYYTLDECGDDYKHSISNFTIPWYMYNGSEILCCDDTLGWIVYVSHEDTISFGGDELITQVKELLHGYESKFNVWENSDN